MQGYLVGNGVTDEQIDGNALIPFVHGMGLISDDLYEVKINPSIIARSPSDSSLFNLFHHLNRTLN